MVTISTLEREVNDLRHKSFRGSVNPLEFHKKKIEAKIAAVEKEKADMEKKKESILADYKAQQEATQAELDKIKEKKET
jgi:hypothetical protein